MPEGFFSTVTAVKIDKAVTTKGQATRRHRAPKKQAVQAKLDNKP